MNVVQRGKIVCFLLQSHNLLLPKKTPLTEFLLIYLKPENCADAMHRKSTSFFNVKEGSAFHTLADFDFQSFISRFQVTRSYWLFEYNIFDIWFIFLDWVQERKLLKYVQDRMFICENIIVVVLKFYLK